MNRERPFFAWPGWRHLGLAAGLIVLVSAWFALIYVGSDWITAHRVMRVRVHLDAELEIPLIPAFTPLYMSIYFLFLIAPFVLRTEKEMMVLAIAQGLTILTAGICFLLIPASLAYAPASDQQLGVWKKMFVFADRLNLDYNLVPSLHVALSIVGIELLIVSAGSGIRWGFRAWGVLIAASTVLLHQHHLLDVFAGYILAFAVVRWVTSKHQKILSGIEIIKRVSSPLPLKRAVMKSITKT